MAASEAGVAFVDFLKSAGLPEKLWSALLQKVESGELGTDGQLKVLPESFTPVPDNRVNKTQSSACLMHDWCVGARQCRRTEWARSLLAPHWTRQAPCFWLRMQPVALACRC